LSSSSHVPADVVLLHFGGPTRREEVQPFLERLFQDPFIIRAPLGTWGRRKLGEMIARRRWMHTDEQYAKIGYSPINRYTDVQAQHLDKLVRGLNPDSRVHVVNRYTAPFAREVVPRLERESSRRLFLATLYPHFSHSTAGSSIRDFDTAWETVHGVKTRTSTRVFSWWWHQQWVEYSWQALREALERAVAGVSSDGGGSKTITVLFSAHGLPQKYADRGDPYPHDIRAHYAELVRRGEAWIRASAAGVECKWELSFQSRVGPVEWMRPYTEDVIAASGTKNGGTLVIVPISFVSDHIETLYEMDVTYRELSLRSGFSRFERVKMPNEDPKLAAVIFAVLRDFGL